MSREAIEEAIEVLEDASAEMLIETGDKNYYVEAIAVLRQALVDADDTSQERVDEMVKTEHDTLGSEWAECVKLPIVVHVRNQREGETHISTREGITPVLPDDLIMRGVAGEEYPIGRELFERTYTFETAPPKQWVSLTDEEMDELVNRFARYGLAREIESKLKEKNGG